MTRTTAILNLKGGVAKTTTAINMAAILAKQHGYRVLAIDADSQCNTTEFFGGDPKKGSLASLLRRPPEDMALAARLIQPTGLARVDLLPGDDSLMDLDLSKVEAGTVRADAVARLIRAVADRYDYILIDCPPAFNAASAAALTAADDVIIPIKLDAFSLRGMGNLTRQVRNMRAINPKLELAGVLPTMWYPDPELCAAEEQLRASGLRVFRHIRRSDKVDAMTFRQQPLTISSPRSAAGVDYRRFVKQYLEGGNGNGL